MITKKKDLYGTRIRSKDSKEGKKVQDKLFELGFTWSGQKEYRYLDNRNIFIDKSHWLSYGGDEEHFRTHKNREITVEELLGEEMKTYQVSEEFIKEAHTAACSGWKTKLENEIMNFPI